MLARIRWPNVAAAVLVAVVLLAVVAWPALEPPAPDLPPGPATAIRSARPEPSPTPTPARPPRSVPGGFERRSALADTRTAGGRVGAGAGAHLPPPPPPPRRAPPQPAVTPAPVAYAPPPTYYAPPAHREFSTFER